MEGKEITLKEKKKNSKLKKTRMVKKASLFFISPEKQVNMKLQLVTRKDDVSM